MVSFLAQEKESELGFCWRERFRNVHLWHGPSSGEVHHDRRTPDESIAVICTLVGQRVYGKHESNGHINVLISL
jgi:hypothetical protein